MPPEPRRASPPRPSPPPQANERTALGWQRSSLSLALIAAILLGHAVRAGHPGGVAAAAVIAVGAGWIGHLGRRLYRRRREAVQDPAVGPLGVMTVVTLIAAAVAAGIVLVGTPS
jgi:uncharacterized membrane protein YidH (DUF202 family)